MNWAPSVYLHTMLGATNSVVSKRSSVGPCLPTVCNVVWKYPKHSRSNYMSDTLNIMFSAIQEKYKILWEHKIVWCSVNKNEVQITDLVSKPSGQILVVFLGKWTTLCETLYFFLKPCLWRLSKILHVLVQC